MMRVRTLPLVLCLMFLGGFIPADLGAQESVQRLLQPEATYGEPFALVQRVRELADGRVVVADPLGQVLLIVDLRAGRADTLGGVGQGPAEYRQPDAVYALPDDSTLLVDLGNARLTALGPDGSFGKTMPMTRGSPSPGGGLLVVMPRGVDAAGRIYFQPVGGGMARGFPDSAAVVRLERQTGAMDTLTQVKLPEVKQSTSGGPGNQNVMIMPIPLSPQDAWAVARDGRIAVARSGDYHVEWISPEGGVVRGRPIDYEPVRIRRADKEEWAESAANGVRIGISVSDGDRRVTLGRGGGGGGPDIDSLDWPETKPAFADDGIWVTPEGYMWVRRQVAAGEPVRFDVFGPDANLRGAIMLPAGRRIVGFGRDTVYVTRTDDLGLQWLERYRRSAS
jgi:hypothetical protein